MNIIISLLLIITIIEAAPPPAASQYEGRAVGAVPCYLGCCKLMDIVFSFILFFRTQTTSVL